MVTQDIDKAQASSLKKGISTIRQTNPLMPNYQYPGGKETNKWIWILFDWFHWCRTKSTPTASPSSKTPMYALPHPERLHRLLQKQTTPPRRTPAQWQIPNQSLQLRRLKSKKINWHLPINRVNHHWSHFSRTGVVAGRLFGGQQRGAEPSVLCQKRQNTQFRRRVLFNHLLSARIHSFFSPKTWSFRNFSGFRQNNFSFRPRKRSYRDNIRSQSISNL